MKLKRLARRVADVLLGFCEVVIAALLAFVFLMLIVLTMGHPNG